MIEAHLAVELHWEGRTVPCIVHTIDHPDGLVLVDTGMIDSTPELDEEWQPMHPPASATSSPSASRTS